MEIILPNWFDFYEEFEEPIPIYVKPIGKALSLNFIDKKYKIYGVNNFIVFENDKKSKRYSIYTAPEVINDAYAIEVPVESRDVIVYVKDNAYKK